MLDLATNPFREGLADDRVADPCAFVIFGATGDLTRRKLIPALFSLFLEGLLPSNFSIIGFARRDWTDDSFRDEMWKRLQEYAKHLTTDEQAWYTFAQSLYYSRGTFEDPAGYQGLKERLGELDKVRETHGNRLFYLSTPPDDYNAIIKNVGDAGLHSQERGWARIIVEKPIGIDLHSARELNSQIRGVFPESSVYRIDHFLGKETVQN
ncbi:MAG: glucose-6-phosphate dehydrogenase, partial [Armatimonadota bacterium]